MLVKIILLIILVILGVSLGPLLFLWCVKTIAPGLGIEYGWTTWFAALVLTMGFFGSTISSGKG